MHRAGRVALGIDLDRNRSRARAQNHFAGGRCHVSGGRHGLGGDDERQCHKKRQQGAEIPLHAIELDRLRGIAKRVRRCHTGSQVRERGFAEGP